MTNNLIRCSSPGLFAEGVKETKPGVLQRAEAIFIDVFFLNIQNSKVLKNAAGMQEPALNNPIQTKTFRNTNK
jgi:hypothetical protein